MFMTGFHPAPGLSELLPGWFVVPQNPILAGGSAAVKYTPRIGDLIAAKYSVPQNPILAADRRLAGIGCGGGCSCSGRCENGMGGLLDDPLGSIESTVSSITSYQIMGIPAWWIGAGLLAVWFLSHPGSTRAARSAEMASARAAYLRKKARIKSTYSVRRQLGDRLGY